MGVGVIAGGIQVISMAVCASYLAVLNEFVELVNVSFKNFKCLEKAKMSKVLYHTVNDVSEFLSLHEECTRNVLIVCAVLVIVGGIVALYTRNKKEPLVKGVSTEEENKKTK